ncbi:MAG: ABC transporter permease [Legionella sp.]|uniref:ABC transporter permease n=1 Tax=Legionella sp. TaxID=459 RepID=UPI0039E5E158
MSFIVTSLTQQEEEWILARRVSRLTDNKEVQIYPMGAERYLSLQLFGQEQERYDIRSAIVGKDVLVIPGYGNSSFLFVEAGAKSVIAYDKDAVTIAWLKAFKKYYHYREGVNYPSVGELLTALTRWYPPIITLPSGRVAHVLSWLFSPNSLRRAYIHYMIDLIQQAVRAHVQECEWDRNIQFFVGTADDLLALKEKPHFDTAFVPYLLGVRHGIEQEQEIVTFIKQLLHLVLDGQILISPSRATKEFYAVGKSYFETVEYSNIQDIPGLKTYVVAEDKYWFRTQGLAAFAASRQKKG